MFLDMMDTRHNYSAQNLYVQPPTRGVPPSSHAHLHPLHNVGERLEDKNNLARLAGRSRGPILNVSLSQLDQPATPVLHGDNHGAEDGDDPPPRPPPPRPEGKTICL